MVQETIWSSEQGAQRCTLPIQESLRLRQKAVVWCQPRQHDKTLFQKPKGLKKKKTRKMGLTYSYKGNTELSMGHLESMSIGLEAKTAWFLAELVSEFLVSFSERDQGRQSLASVLSLLPCKVSYSILSHLKILLRSFAWPPPQWNHHQKMVFKFSSSCSIILPFSLPLTLP